MVEILGIIGSQNVSSKTRAAVEVVLDGAETERDASTEVLHLAEYDLTTADGRPLDECRGETAEALEMIVRSDAYVLGSPVYKASYSGALKNLLDMIPRGKWMADVAPLQNSAIGLVATGASWHHFMSIDTEMRPLMGFFGSYAAGGVYAHHDHFDDAPTVVDEDIHDRLATLGAATVELQEAIDGADYLTEIGLQI